MKKITENKQQPSIWQVIASVLSAFFGVQKNVNRERDFQQGKPWVFIVVGIAMAIIFVFAIILVVKLVLAQTV